MSILDQLEKLQKKPRETREKILAVSVFIFMALVVTVWVSVAKERFSAVSDSGAENPLKSLWSAVGFGIEEIKKQINFLN